ncbi:MAG: site-specific integrase [Clostridium sp.]|nr:site-specific integrase [Clostridium sp.]
MKQTMTKYGLGTFYGAIHDYLEVYLPNQRNLSTHTIASYRETLNLLVDFIAKFHHVPLLDVTFEMLSAEAVTAFLDYLEAERNNTISSRNTRLAAVKAFSKYAADRNIAYTAIREEMNKVVTKRPNKAPFIEYMSMAAISAIVEQTDLSSPIGLRDRTMLILLYDTGARVQELVGIRLKDIKLGRQPTVTVHGKRNKIRTIPLMTRTVEYLKKYLLTYHDGVPSVSEAPLFYSEAHGERFALSDRRVRYILKNYGEKARQSCPEVPENVHPHMFRHSRAMHLYQNGMDLALVSEWLGHEQLETTKIYAHADTEHKRSAIAKATPSESPLSSKLSAQRFIISDEETLKRLSGLQK